MKTKFLILALFLQASYLYSQEDYSERTKYFITGYVAINGEYVHNLPTFKELQQEAGINIAESSVLTTINPSKRVSIFSVLTYKPRLDVNSIIAELSGQYSFSEEFAIKVGRFLLPINPINAHYYAPTNVGIALPSFITNHKLFPLNMNGIDFNGHIHFNEDIQMKYNLIAGQYSQIEQTTEGIVGFFGREGIYRDDNIKTVKAKIERLDSLDKLDYPQFWGGAFRVAFDLGSYFKIGFGGFYGSEENSIIKTDKIYKSDIDVYSFGSDIGIDYCNFSLKSSLWFGNEKPTNMEYFVKKDYRTINFESTYTFWGELSPYAKYELIHSNDKSKGERFRFIGGLNYRPNYEIALKLEYIRYMQNYLASFNVFQLSVVFSF